MVDALYTCILFLILSLGYVFYLQWRERDGHWLGVITLLSLLLLQPLLLLFPQRPVFGSAPLDAFWHILLLITSVIAFTSIGLLDHMLRIRTALQVDATGSAAGSPAGAARAGGPEAGVSEEEPDTPPDVGPRASESGDGADSALPVPHTADLSVEELAVLPPHAGDAFRAGLSAIRGYASILHEVVPDDHRALTQLLERNTSRLLDAFEALRELLLLERNRVPLTPQLFSVRRLLEDQAALARTQLDDRPVDVNVTGVTEGDTARLDRSCVRRVVEILVRNACKYTREGQVGLHVDVRDERVLIQVRDTGVGMAPDVLSRLVVALGTDAADERGDVPSPIGLGLAIVRRRVALLKGRLTVTSTPDFGTVFTLSLPRNLEGRVPVAEPMGDGSADALWGPQEDRPARVLILEDNPETLELLDLFLSEKYDVTSVTNPIHLLEQARGKPFDIVLLDIKLGQVQHGIDLLQAVRKIRKSAHVPVVALAAYGLPEERTLLMKAGFNDYLLKPFTVQQLYQTITQAVGSPARMLES